MQAFEKTLNPGRILSGTLRSPRTGRNMRAFCVPVFCKISYDGARLSITGVEGPLENGDAVGSCGQIDLRIDECARGWDADKISRFRELWKRWHLNDMRAGCEHQRAEGWAERPIDPRRPLSDYDSFCGPNVSPSWNMLTWVTRKEHPKGLLSEPCSTCGYRYGSAWLREEVPAEVLEWLNSLPEAEQKPAWI